MRRVLKALSSCVELWIVMDGYLGNSTPYICLYSTSLASRVEVYSLLPLRKADIIASHRGSNPLHYSVR
jgi:hypothetical protein